MHATCFAHITLFSLVITRTINISPVLGYRQIQLPTTLATSVRGDSVREMKLICRPSP
jgi:hypothetical protein